MCGGVFFSSFIFFLQQQPCGSAAFLTSVEVSCGDAVSRASPLISRRARLYPRGSPEADERISHQFYKPLASVCLFLMCRPQGTRSPTAWTAGTRSAGPRWRWAPTAASSPSRASRPSRPTCSGSSPARRWAGGSNWKLWWWPPSGEVSLVNHICLWVLGDRRLCFLTQVLCFYIRTFSPEQQRWSSAVKFLAP